MWAASPTGRSILSARSGAQRRKRCVVGYCGMSVRRRSGRTAARPFSRAGPRGPGMLRGAWREGRWRLPGPETNSAGCKSPPRTAAGRSRGDLRSSALEQLSPCRHQPGEEKLLSVKVSEHPVCTGYSSGRGRWAGQRLSRWHSPARLRPCRRSRPSAETRSAGRAREADQAACRFTAEDLPRLRSTSIS